MRNILAYSITAALAACLTMPVLAQQSGQNQDPEKVFTKADANADGKLSLEEFLGKNTKNVERRTQRFKKMDADSDGFVTKKEFMDASQAARKKSE